MKNAEQKPLSVKEFIQVINGTLSPLSAFEVIGEVAEFSINQGKWVFFKLKETDAVIDCFTTVHQLSIDLTDGMMVVIKGAPRIYPKSGRFSITVQEIRPYGEGSLHKAFLLLKDKLEKEGLFSPARKRSIIKFPERIGVISSRASAGYKDFMKIVNQRFGGMTVSLIHVSVQGSKARDEICSAFNYFNAHPTLSLDALALIRGGGSLEDLSVFNDEKIGRSIFASKIPVITGIGHEKDVTIADLVADVRASTPSNAAELLVPDRVAITRELALTVRHIETSVESLCAQQKNTLNTFQATAHHFVIDQKNRLNTEIHRLTEHCSSTLSHIATVQQSIATIASTLSYLMHSIFDTIHKELSNTLSLLRSLNPYSVLQRGYSITSTTDGKIISSITAVKPHDHIITRMGDGIINSEIKQLTPSDEKTRERKI